MAAKGPGRYWPAALICTGSRLPGEAGVRHTIDILSEELRMYRGLCEATSTSDLDPDLLRVSGPLRIGRVTESLDRTRRQVPASRPQ